jgi:hypothetical protein
MTAKAKQQPELAAFFEERVQEIATKIGKLAAEFPEAKFEDASVTGARTFGAVVRHVAFWNQYVADSLLGQPANDAGNELALAEYPTKARMVEALEKSSGRVIAALNPHSLDAIAVRMVMSYIEHNCEHYGQLAVYSRLAGIVPPASRGV